MEELEVGGGVGGVAHTNLFLWKILNLKGQLLLQKLSDQNVKKICEFSHGNKNAKFWRIHI